MKNKKLPLIGIIGGKGRMGSWFKNFFEKQGLRVIISDKNTPLSNIKLAKTADITIISVPLAETIKVIKEVRDYIRENALLADLASLKMEPVQEMKKTKGGWLGMHPLFGPLVPDIKNQNIVFCSRKKKRGEKQKGGIWIKFLKDIFEKNEARVIEISPERHDKEMAFIQALVHFNNLSFSHFIYRKNFQPLPYLLTPTFKLQSLVLGRILSQKPEVYAHIAMKNPFFKKFLKEYQKEIDKLGKLIERQDYKTFKRYFKEAASFLSGSIRVAEGKTTDILKIIEKQPIQIGNLKKLKIKKASMGFLGPEGTFSWIAAKKISPQSFTLRPFLTIRDIFESINNFDIDFGVVPIENSIGGIVSETIYCLVDYPLYTLGSFKMPIHHCLLSKTKNLKEIEVVKSHPQALSQCRLWLRENLPSVLKVPTQSTVSPILEQKLKKTTGFIAPCIAGKIFSLNILAKNIEDNKNNFTKFLLVTRELNKDLLKKVTVDVKNTLLLFSVYDRPGILRDILSVFADKNINLSALHSIPSYSRPWDYLFFVEIEKPFAPQEIKNILKELQRFCPFARIIGVA